MFACVLVALLHSHPQSQELNNASWEIVNKNGIMGVNGRVYALCFVKGDLYIGGNFTVAGNVAAQSIVKWNGTEFSALGQGADSTVYAITSDTQGNIFAGGEFKTAGGITVNHIAKWDGSSWSALGKGTDSSVSSLIIGYDNSLFAGGRFKVAGETVARCVAQWDGTTWNRLTPDSISPFRYFSNVAGNVKAFALDGKGGIYVGGTQSCIARWNGSSWDSLGSGVVGDVNAFTLDSVGNLYVGGKITIAGKREQIFLARWNGSQWDSLPSTFWYPGSWYGVNALAFDKTGNLYSGGYFQEFSNEHIFGIACNGKSSSLTEECYALACDTGTTVYSGGIYGIRKWDGKAWVEINAGMDGVVNKIVVNRKGSMYVGGAFTTIDGFNSSAIIELGSNGWNEVPSGVSYTYYHDGIESMACDSSGNLYVGGKLSSIGGVATRYCAKWNGVVWSPLEKEIDYSSAGNTNVTSLLCSPDGRLYVGGFFGIASQNIYNLGEWNGSSWKSPGIIKSFVNSPEIFDMLLDKNGDLFIGGHFSQVDSIKIEGLARCVGSHWDSSFYIAGEACALTMDEKGAIYVGGNFFRTFSSGNYMDANNIAQWNGSSWDTLGSGIIGSVKALTFDDQGNLFAGGSFTKAGDVAVNNIARWNGSEWCSVGSGTDDAITTLAYYNSSLYVGGKFLKVGGIVSPYIARIALHGSGISAKKIPEAATVEKVSFKQIASKIYFSNISPTDKIALYSLSGKCLYETHGVSCIGLRNISSQSLLLCVKRGRNVISRGVIWQ